MVKMIRDNTGRFAERPFYAARDLDDECERLICELLVKRHGKVDYPVETDDLTVLIEMHDADLDPYADLSAYGPDVEGVTEFFPNRRPKVSISERIAADERRENRFRTTLTHEFGHVKFHGPLWAQKFANGDLLERGVNSNKAISKRDNILDAPQSDWMEWQAGYISGALLMPATPVRRLGEHHGGLGGERQPAGRHLRAHRKAARRPGCSDSGADPHSHGEPSG